MTYKLTNTTTIIRIQDGASIPNDPRNADYANYLLWVAAGNTPTPVDVPTLAQDQVTQINLLLASYSNAIQQPVSYTTIAGVVKTYQANTQSVDNLSRMTLAYLKAAATPTGFYWMATDNTKVPFTFADLQQLAAVMGTQGFADFDNLQTKKASVMAATTVSAVQLITF